MTKTSIDFRNLLISRFPCRIYLFPFTPFTKYFLFRLLFLLLF